MMKSIGGGRHILLRVVVASKKILSIEDFVAYLTDQWIALVVVLMSPRVSKLVKYT